MKYSFYILDKAIDKWITKAYTLSPNKQYAVEYLYKNYGYSDNIFIRNLSESFKKIADECYHLYSLGKYDEVQYLFSSDYEICRFFLKEEIDAYLNEKIIINTTIIDENKKYSFLPPPNYKIIDDYLKKEIYKFCRGLIISKEIIRKLEKLPEFIIDENINRVAKKSDIKNESIVENMPIINIESSRHQKEEINIFCKGMLLNIPREHFKVFTLNNSKHNDKPFLDAISLDLFIRKAFMGEKNIPKLRFNQAPKGEKLLIQDVFYNFYYEYSLEYFFTTQNQRKFIELLTQNFHGWEINTVEKKFKPDIKGKRLTNISIVNH